MLTRNRHPVDELADVRAEIKTLQGREAELRAALLEEGADLSGSQFYARITVSERETIDSAAAIRALGRDALARFMRKQSTTTIRLVEREPTEDAA